MGRGTTRHLDYVKHRYGRVYRYFRNVRLARFHGRREQTSFWAAGPAGSGVPVISY